MYDFEYFTPTKVFFGKQSNKKKEVNDFGVKA